MFTTREKYLRRKFRNSAKIKLRKNGLPRLSVFRSNQHIYAQVIDDTKRTTLVAASTMDKALKKLKVTANVEAAAQVGKMIAERALSKGLEKVVLDRGGYVYHGRLKAVADAAREHGLKF
jgi:large subunit ribosomal protein L18